MLMTILIFNKMYVSKTVLLKITKMLLQLPQVPTLEE